MNPPRPVEHNVPGVRAVANTTLPQESRLTRSMGTYWPAEHQGANESAPTRT